MIKPILFNTDMVRAILDERKTVTRRLVKFLPGENPNWTGYIKDGLMLYNGNNEPCCRKSPYQVGDVMYVRETWSEGYGEGTYIYKADDKLAELPEFKESSKLIYHPSIHMPKEAARLWLKVTDVRMERLQEITADGIRSEGLSSMAELLTWRYLEKELGTKVENMIATAKREVEESLVKSLEQKLKENLAKETIERMNIPDALKRFSEMALEDKAE